jgi:hypothetical protein
MMTPAEVAEFTQISEVRLATWRSKSVGPPWVKMGDGRNGAVRYPREDLRKYIDANTTSSAAGVV